MELRCFVCHANYPHHFLPRDEHDVKEDMQRVKDEFTALHAACGLELEDYDVSVLVRLVPAPPRWEAFDPFNARMDQLEHQLKCAQYHGDWAACDVLSRQITQLRCEQMRYKIEHDRAMYEVRPMFILPSGAVQY
jgi:hypothetical protein